MRILLNTIKYWQYLFDSTGSVHSCLYLGNVLVFKRIGLPTIVTEPSRAKVQIGCDQNCHRNIYISPIFISSRQRTGIMKRLLNLS